VVGCEIALDAVVDQRVDFFRESIKVVGTITTGEVDF